MKWANIRWGILDMLGYILCGISLWWWKLFNCNLAKPHSFSYIRSALYFIGIPSYKLGCFFYGLQDYNGSQDHDP